MIARLAVVALRAVVQELEGDEAASAAALHRLLATTQPAARRPERDEARRPAPAARAGELAAPAADSEGARLARALIDRHGTATAAATALGMAVPLLCRWAKGRAFCSPASLERLRAAQDLATDGRTADEGEPTTVPGQPEAREIVGRLVARHDGDLRLAAERYGFGDAAMERWAAGGPCSPRALERLRHAATFLREPD